MLGNRSRPLGLWLSVFVSLASLTGALCANAQDVAEAARQQRARQATQGQAKSKIYTNEDLKKPQILTPEDHSRVETAKKDPASSPNPTQAQSVDAVNESSQESLAEIARRYRREKQARRAEQAEKASPSRFKMDLAKDALAAPDPSHVATVVPPARHPEPGKSVLHAAPARRDPFSRAWPLLASRGSISAVAPANLGPRKSLPVGSVSALKLEPSVISSARTTVTIQSGDSLWKLARRYLGRGSRWHELLAANAGLPDPNRIRAGGLLVIPQAASGIPARSPDMNDAN